MTDQEKMDNIHRAMMLVAEAAELVERAGLEEYANTLDNTCSNLDTVLNDLYDKIWLTNNPSGAILHGH